MSSALLALLLLSADPQPADVALIAPRELLPALRPLVEHRQSQGHRFTQIDSNQSAGSGPTHLHKAVVNVRWGSEPEIASDNWYADLDDDHLPDVAIGRIPADTPAELARIVEKILAYERATDFGAGPRPRQHSRRAIPHLRLR
jgi:hypothetical protein